MPGSRGDILRKVLERTGITAGRPLNLRRGGVDASHGAELLRKLRGFSRNAALLSSKLDNLIEFKYPAAVLESSWRKWKKPSRLTFGKILRRYGGETPHGGRLDKLGNVTPLSRPLPTIAFRFSIKPPRTPVHATRYPSTVLESVWRRIKKPTRVSDVLKDTPAANMPKTMNQETEKAINVTKRKMTVIQRKADKKHKDWEQLSSRLDDVINFDSITYHETEAERHSRKARGHREKAESALKLGGYATAAGAASVAHPFLRGMGERAVRKVGTTIIEKSPSISGILPSTGHFIASHAKPIFKAAAFAPVAALGGYYAGHKVGSWRQDKKVDEELKRANEARRIRNAVVQSKTQLSVPINFDYRSEAEQIQEHAKKEATKTAVEVMYEKLLKGEKPRIRLSSQLDRLINFQDPRPRNPLGEFQPQSEGGPDPNAMATVYKQPQQQGAGMTLPKAAGAALAGGALGAIGGEAGKAGWKKAASIVKRLAAKRKSVLVK